MTSVEVQSVAFAIVRVALSYPGHVCWGTIQGWDESFVYVGGVVVEFTFAFLRFINVHVELALCDYGESTVISAPIWRASHTYIHTENTWTQIQATKTFACTHPLRGRGVHTQSRQIPPSTCARTPAGWWWYGGECFMYVCV